jgi:hypothetical protein
MTRVAVRLVDKCTLSGEKEVLARWQVGQYNGGGVSIGRPKVFAGDTIET